MKRFAVGLILILVSLWGIAAWAGPDPELIEALGSGEINWSKGIITAKGSGAPPKEAKNIAQARLMAERAALADARRNLLEVLKGVRVDSATLVENFMVKSDQIRLQAEGFIQGSVELKNQRKYLSDGAIEVTVAMSMSGDFLSLMLSPPLEVKTAKPPVEKPLSEFPPLPPAKKVEPVPGQPAPKPEVIPEAKQGVKTEAKPQVKPLPPLSELPKFTGLVLDVRGLNMRPALIPRVFDESGQELYQGKVVPREKAAQNGLALYSRDLTAAQTNPRVGKNPLTLKGSKVNSESPSDIILSAQESERLLPFTQKGTFLEDCRVVIVMD